MSFPVLGKISVRFLCTRDSACRYTYIIAILIINRTSRDESSGDILLFEIIWYSFAAFCSSHISTASNLLTLALQDITAVKAYTITATAKIAHIFTSDIAFVLLRNSSPGM